MKLLRGLWPVFIIIFIWFLFSSPYFIKGLVPFPSEYQVNFFPPWSSNEQFWGPYKNGAMPDVIDQIYPWRHFTIETWKNGQIPFWNPNSFSGNPHLANYQSTVLSPFNLLFFVLPFVDAWSINVLLQPLLAGIFMFILLKEFKISNVSSLLGSVTFMFCGYIVVWMAYGTLSLAIAFLPLAIYALESSYKKIRFLTSVILIISIPLSFFSGHFQTSIYFMAALFMFLAFKAIQTKEIRKTLILLFFFGIGLLLSLPQILPSIQLYQNSVRSEIFIAGGGIPFSYLATIFSPDFFGNPVTRNDWFGYYAEWAGFIGIIPLFFSFYAISKKNTASIFFLFLGIISLLLAIDSPVQKFMGNLKIPVLSTSTPSRIIVLFSFSFSVLAAFGLENIRNMIEKREVKKIVIPAVIFLTIFTAIWFQLLFGKALPLDKALIAKRNMILPTLLLVILLVFGILNLLIKKKKILYISTIIIVFLGCFDSFRFVQKWMPFDSKDLVFSKLPVIEAMQKNIGYGRIFGNLGAHVDTFFSLPSIEGYDPLYIGRYGEFIASAAKGELTEPARSVVRLERISKNTDNVLDLLGVNIIFHPIGDTNQSWAYPVWQDKDRFKLIYQDSKFQLFKNNYAFPKAKLFYDYEFIKDKNRIIKRFYSENFDFRNKLILEENIGNLKKGEGSVSMLEYTPNRIKLLVKTNQPGLVFIPDNYYPGWKAKVNGLETKIYRADYSFRAILVPAGISEVNFTYFFEPSL